MGGTWCHRFRAHQESADYVRHYLCNHRLAHSAASDIHDRSGQHHRCYCRSYRLLALLRRYHERYFHDLLSGLRWACCRLFGTYRTHIQGLQWHFSRTSFRCGDSHRTVSVECSFLDIDGRRRPRLLQNICLRSVLQGAVSRQPHRRVARHMATSSRPLHDRWLQTKRDCQS